MKKAISLFILFLFVLINSSASEVKENKKGNFNWPKNRIGVSGSTFTGYGLTYYRHFGNKFVGKICMVAYGSIDGYDNNSKEFTYIIGTEFQYNIKQTKFSRLHLFAAFSNWYDENSYISGTEINNYKNLSIDRDYVVGIGFGVEFLAWHIISFNLETGLMGRFGVNTNFEDNQMGMYVSKSYPKVYGFGIGGGISYAF